MYKKEITPVQFRFQIIQSLYYKRASVNINIQWHLVYDDKSICNDPDQMKEKWRNGCLTHKVNFGKPNLFYKNIGCVNWPKVKACDFDQNEFEGGKKRACNFSSPSAEYLKIATL